MPTREVFQQSDEPSDSYCHETMGHDVRLHNVGDIRIRSMTELCTEAGVLTEDVYFEGGYIARCYEGRFRFGVKGWADVEIVECESVIIYPERRVTIEALGKKNLMRYAILDGADVASYLDHFGFTDCIHGKTCAQRAIFKELERRLALESGLTTPAMMALLSDALVTYAHDFQGSGNALIFSIIRQIRENLRNRIVRIDPLCEQMKISRAGIYRAFAAAGIGSPAEFIRNEQLQAALRLLGNPTKAIADVADETGFISTSHFATFVRRATGLSPSEYRKRGASGATNANMMRRKGKSKCKKKRSGKIRKLPKPTTGGILSSV